MIGDEHRATEQQWLADRESLIDRLANQSIIAPSRLSHEVADAPDPPPEPDPETYVHRTPKGRGGTALGHLAVRIGCDGVGWIRDSGCRPESRRRIGRGTPVPL